MIELEKELVRLGLSEKESMVYLAAIQIGPSPVQKISYRAKVNRATTYVIIESLMEMGLMSKYEEGKKTYFVAEKPERLVDYFESREKDLHEKLSRIKEMVPELDTLYNDMSDKPKVKYFEGVEGLKAVQNDFYVSLKEEEAIYTFLPYDEFERSVLNKKLQKVKKGRLAKKVNVKVIYTSETGRKQEYEARGRLERRESMYIEQGAYPFNGGMNIYGNKIFMIDYQGKLGGIVIENKTLAQMLKQLFLVAWKSNKEKIV